MAGDLEYAEKYKRTPEMDRDMISRQATYLDALFPIGVDPQCRYLPTQIATLLFLVHSASDHHSVLCRPTTFPTIPTHAPQPEKLGAVPIISSGILNKLSSDSDY